MDTTAGEPARKKVSERSLVVIGTVWLAFEFNCGDCTFPLIATMQDVEHSSSSRCLIFGCTPLGAMPKAQVEPE